MNKAGKISYDPKRHREQNGQETIQVNDQTINYENMSDRRKLEALASLQNKGSLKDNKEMTDLMNSISQ